jgi:hypothetical protein
MMKHPSKDQAFTHRVAGDNLTDHTKGFRYIDADGDVWARYDDDGDWFWVANLSAPVTGVVYEPLSRTGKVTQTLMIGVEWDVSENVPAAHKWDWTDLIGDGTIVVVLGHDDFVVREDKG